MNRLFIGVAKIVVSCLIVDGVEAVVDAGKELYRTYKECKTMETFAFDYDVNYKKNYTDDDAVDVEYVIYD